MEGMEHNERNGIEVFKLKHERLSPMEKLIKKLEHYRLVGLPFYNEVVKKQEFTDEFKKTLKL